MDKEIEVAVQWWADRLTHGAKQDNGDAITGALMGMLQGRMKPPSAEQIQTFKDALAASLREKPRYGLHRSIVCDYHPDMLLRDAATKAGIEADCPPFPIKTGMSIEPGSVKVRYGYGAPTVDLMDATSTRNKA